MEHWGILNLKYFAKIYAVHRKDNFQFFEIPKSADVMTSALLRKDTPQLSVHFTRNRLITHPNPIPEYKLSRVFVMISVPMLLCGHPPSTVMRLWVFFTDFTTVSISSGLIVRRFITWVIKQNKKFQKRACALLIVCHEVHQVGCCYPPYINDSAQECTKLPALYN